MTLPNMDEWDEEQKKAWKELESREKVAYWRRDIEQNLHASLRKLDPNQEFRWEPQQHLDDEGDRHSVDVVGMPNIQGKRRVFVEIEADRATCVRNIIKIWMPVSECTLKQPAMIIQVFSPNYISKKEKKKKETIFVGNKAEKDTDERLIYRFIQLPSWLSSDEIAARIMSVVVADS